MQKIFESIQSNWIKSCLVVIIAGLMFVTNLSIAPSSHAASKPAATCN